MEQPKLKKFAMELKGIKDNAWLTAGMIGLALGGLTIGAINGIVKNQAQSQIEVSAPQVSAPVAQSEQLLDKE